MQTHRSLPSSPAAHELAAQQLLLAGGAHHRTKRSMNHLCGPGCNGGCPESDLFRQQHARKEKRADKQRDKLKEKQALLVAAVEGAVDGTAPQASYRVLTD